MSDAVKNAAVHATSSDAGNLDEDVIASRGNSPAYIPDSPTKEYISTPHANEFSGITSFSSTYKPNSGDPSRGRATKYGVKWDQSISCRLCGIKFSSPFKRKYHCFFCGRCVCSSCSRKRLPKVNQPKLRCCDSECLSVYFTTVLQLRLNICPVLENPNLITSNRVVASLHRMF